MQFLLFSRNQKQQQILTFSRIVELLRFNVITLRNCLLSQQTFWGRDREGE